MVTRPTYKYYSETNQMELSLVGGPIHERRGAKRYPIQLGLRYSIADRLAEVLGTAGKTLNMSRSGILLSTQEWIHPGQVLVVSVDWPARPDGACTLKFVATGTVVRSADQRVAMRIQRYEFRTRNFSVGILKSWDLGIARPTRLPKVDERPKVTW